MAKIIFTYHTKDPEVPAPLHQLLVATGQQAALLEGVSVSLYRGVEEDPFRTNAGITRASLAAIAVVSAESGLPIQQLDSLTRAFSRAIAAEKQVECSLVVASENRFKSVDEFSIHYMYFMARKSGFCRADYMDYYMNRHCRFGMQTMGIGYVQNYVDPMETARLAGEMGVSALECDSISEMHIKSMPAFFAENDIEGMAESAAADEELFVDRKSSSMISMERFF